jgi:threonine dehydrogenase-like Zn-dependent dehydrogenase
MKAFRIVEPGKTEIIDVPKPSPAPDEVLLRVAIVGYCGSDLNSYRGANALVSYPRIPCHEVAGVIEERGSEVPEAWAEGREITLSPTTSCGLCPACRQGRFNCCRDNRTLGNQRDGALQEYIAVPWKKLFASPRLSLGELVLVEPLTVGFHAVSRGQVSKADAVLVYGCGAVGLGAIAGAVYRGARVIAVDIDEAKLGIARACGASEAINSASAPVHERLRELTHGDGPDVVIEAAGQAETYRAAVEEVAFAGRVVYIGYAKKAVEFETRNFVLKELDIRGSRNATPEDFEEVILMLEGGAFPTSRVITRRVPFMEAGDALKGWADNPARGTKILVTLDDSPGKLLTRQLLI